MESLKCFMFDLRSFVFDNRIVLAYFWKTRLKK